MLNIFEKEIKKIISLNSAYLLDFSTAQQLVNKLSDIMMRTKHTDELIELRDTSKDTHQSNNYLATMKQIILKCKIEIDNKMDMEELNQKSIGGGGFYACPVQAEN